MFRLNWAAYGVGKAAPAGEDHSLFVGDLAPDVSDIILQARRGGEGGGGRRSGSLRV